MRSPIGGLSRRSLLAAGVVLTGGLAGSRHAHPKASVAERGVVHMAMATVAPPFSWADSGDERLGVVHGVVPELLRLIFATEGSHDIVFEPFPWPRAQQAVRAGQCDGFCTNPTTERRAYAVFGTEPVLVNEFALFVRADHPRLRDIAAITRVDDLRAFRLSDFLGNGVADSLFSSFHNEVAWQRDLEGVFRLIDRGRADVVYANALTGRHVLLRMGLADVIQPLPIRLSPPSAYHIGLREGFPGARTLLEDLDRTILALRESGSLQAVIARSV